MIKREFHSIVEADFDHQKAIILIGARQVGKSTLIADMVKDKNVLMLNGDDPQTRLTLSDANL